MAKGKRKKKTPRKRLVKALDKTCNLAVKLRDNYTCQYCGKPVKGQDCHWAHIIPQRTHFLRWHLLNSLVLCFHHHQDFHAGRITKDGWFKREFPARYNYLHDSQNDQEGMFLPRCNITWKYSITDLEEILEKLKLKVQEMEK